jgi:UDP-N-acetylglucosamine 2-epimerase (non-hydrolysing)/GDP/UDP-N,N'-diacetylbacillosamine 2-epimerase (hydrolysing)
VKIEMEQDTLFSTAQAIGTGILSLSRHLDELRPDFLVVYADRYEGFAAMITGTQMNIPTAHIEGGDYTEGGALDDSVRHAMTKLAHLHFATNQQAVERILRLGEEPWRVFDVGQPSLDLIRAGIFAKPEEVTRDLKLDPARPIVLFCQHSVTTEFEKAAEQVRPSLAALRRLAQEGWQVIVTYPNNDAGGRSVIEELQVLRDVPNVHLTKSLGRYRFHGVLNLIACPAINIGSRQQGRLRADNVLDVEYGADAVYAAILRSAQDAAFRARCVEAEKHNPYGAGNAGPKIAEVLATMPIDERMLRKKMTY